MLYVDEFHAMPTDSFAAALAETRKYGLGLTLTQQHVAQSSSEAFAAIMGNVGSVISFRLGALDAPLISRQFETIPEHDLLGLPNHEAYRLGAIVVFAAAGVTAFTAMS